jgi:uncharacterized protein
LIDFIKREVIGLYRFLKGNFNEVVVLSSAVLFLCLNRYNQVWNNWFSSLLYFAIFPILVGVLVLKRNPLDFGLRLGHIGIWGRYIIIFCIITALVLIASAFNSELQNYYRIKNFNLIFYLLTSFASLFGSEFLFRGFLIFGLKEKFRETSILIQMIPFVIVHFGKPGLETYSTIATGILFGYIVYRGNSFWPAFIIHMFINVFFVASINLLFS